MRNRVLYQNPGHCVRFGGNSCCLELSEVMSAVICQLVVFKPNELMSIVCTTARHDQDLMGILDLQRRNLATNLDEEEIRTQGFVTVLHSMDDLRKMNDIEQHVIALDHDCVVAYLLAMTPASRNDIPVLIPMFETLESITFRSAALSASSYIVVGQACVDRAYRGQGVFDAIYMYYSACFRSRYRYVITEIDALNTRSLRAHRRVGFETIHEYQAPNGVRWHIVLWDWNASQ